MLAQARRVEESIHENPPSPLEPEQQGNLQGRPVETVPTPQEAEKPTACGSSECLRKIVGGILTVVGIIFALIAVLCLSNVFPVALLAGTAAAGVILGVALIGLTLGITMYRGSCCFKKSTPNQSNPQGQRSSNSPNVQSNNNRPNNNHQHPQPLQQISEEEIRSSPVFQIRNRDDMKSSYDDDAHPDHPPLPIRSVSFADSID